MLENEKISPVWNTGALLPETQQGHGGACFPFRRSSYFLIFIISLLLYLGHIVTFTKVITIYHS
jgi:hypothetical protein